MEKIISCKKAARKTIKEKLKKEIPQINCAIEKAIKKGLSSIYYEKDISKSTAKMLKKAGYDVENWQYWDLPTRISWYANYDKLSENDLEVKKIAEKLDIKIVNVQ